MVHLKAVIFDYGNVLSRTQAPEAREEMARRIGLTQERFDHLYWKFRDDYNKGTMNGVTYWEKIAADDGVLVSRNQIQLLIDMDNASWSHPNELTVEWAKQLSSLGFRLGICPICHRFRTFLSLAARGYQHLNMVLTLANWE